MEESYIFVQGQDQTGIFIRLDTVIAVRFDLAKSTAVIATDDNEYMVVGVLAVNLLHDHFYQRSQIKLFRDKQ